MLIISKLEKTWIKCVLERNSKMLITLKLEKMRFGRKFSILSMIKKFTKVYENIWSQSVHNYEVTCGG